MKSSAQNNISSNSNYRLRMLSAIVISELLFILVFNFWPAADTSNDESNYSNSQEVVAMDEAVITEQVSTPPAPPKPQIPIPVPKDEIIEDKVITFDDVSPSDFTDTLSARNRGASGESDKIVSSPRTAPRIIRIVEAVVPDAAKEANIKAGVTVKMLVNTNGKVEEVNIINVRRYDLEGGPKNLPDIGYGISKATKEAALQWKFHSARNDGKKVRAYSKQIFTFGF